MISADTGTAGPSHALQIDVRAMVRSVKYFGTSGLEWQYYVLSILLYNLSPPNERCST